MLERYLLLWLVLSSAIAHQWPWPDADPFVANATLLSVLVAVTMFAIGLMLPKEEVELVARRWPTVLGGTALQYSSMPLLAYTMAKLCGIEGNHFVGLMLVGCVPGAMASNVLTLNARGNTSYSVGLTTSATLLSPLAVPLTLSLALSDANVELSFWKTSQKLLITVVGPVVLGYGLSRANSRCESAGKRWGPKVANVSILWIIAAIVGSTRDILSFGPTLWIVLLALLTTNIAGYAAGYVGGLGLRLNEPMRRALTLEVGMQNAGLGTMLAVNLFDNQEIALAPAMYTFGCMLTGTILARQWAGRAGDQETNDESGK